MTDVRIVRIETTFVDEVAGALRGTYASEFPRATDDDWQSDAEFVLARLQEYGLTLTRKEQTDG